MSFTLSVPLHAVLLTFSFCSCYKVQSESRDFKHLMITHFIRWDIFISNTMGPSIHYGVPNSRSFCALKSCRKVGDLVLLCGSRIECFIDPMSSNVNPIFVSKNNDTSSTTKALKGMYYCTSLKSSSTLMLGHPFLNAC
jgi:hypothetical protein